MQAANEKYYPFIRLTALWALVESGLGGLLHAFHLPITGIVLGGFSILVISLIARTGKPAHRPILKATLIVMAVKFSVNPLTSPMAYIAVGFQGLLGAFFFTLSLHHQALSLFYGGIVMIESAVQKLLVLTIFMGKSLWKAVDIWYAGVIQLFGYTAQTPGSIWVAGIYVGLFALWGIVIGQWIYLLPHQLEARKDKYLAILPEETEVLLSEKKSQKKILILLGIFFFVLLSFFQVSSLNVGASALTLLLRTLGILLIWIYLVLPLWRKAMEKWLQTQNNTNKEVERIMQVIPMLSQYVKPLYREVSLHYKGWERWKELILGLMIISLEHKR